jgi:hypothetical protein
VSHTNEMVDRHRSASLSEYFEENFRLNKSDSDIRLRNPVFIGWEGNLGLVSSRVKSCGEGDELQ